MRALAAGLLTSLALVAGGCGGTSDTTPAAGTGAAASVAPADSIAFVAIDTDLDSEQWNTVEKLLDEFPGKDRALQRLRGELQKNGVDFERDVKPALGPELGIAVLADSAGSGVDAVAYTKPKDRERLSALLQKGDAPHPVSAEIDGWTAIAQDQATLDRARNLGSGASLAEDATFEGAFGKLPEEAVAKVYVNGDRATTSLKRVLGRSAGALEGQGKLTYLVADLVASDDGLRLEGSAKGEGAKSGQLGPAYASQLVSQVPAGALVYLSFRGAGQALDQLRSNPFLQGIPQLGAVAAALGKLGPLLRKEGALYVRPGTPIPEVTLVTQVDDETQAVASVDELIASFGGLLGGRQPVPRQVGGVSAKELDLGRFALLYAAFDGKLVVTTSSTGIRGLEGGGQKLVDDDAFKSARDLVGMPDETNGFLYVNMKDSLPLIEGLAQIAGQPLPADVQQNLEPLRTLIAYATVGQTDSSFASFLQIK